MLPHKRSNLLLPAILALGCAGLGALIYFDLRASAAVDDGFGAQTEPLQIGALPAEPSFVMPPLDLFDEVVARPLFSASRRPTSSVALVPSAPADLSLVLKGVVVSEGTRVALFTDGDAPGLRRLRMGDVYRGWELAEIDQSAVMFRRGGEERRLQISFDEAPAQPVRRLDERERLRARIQAGDAAADGEADPSAAANDVGRR